MEPICTVDEYGCQRWLLPNGRRHRVDGPAVTYADGCEEWWVDGQQITDQVNTWIMKNHIDWPWDISTQIEFVLRFA